MTLNERIKNYVREHFKLFREKEKAVADAYYQGYKDAVKAHWHMCADNTYDYPETKSIYALLVRVIHDGELRHETEEIIFATWLGDTWDLYPWEGERDMEVIAWTYSEDIM